MDSSFLCHSNSLVGYANLLSRLVVSFDERAVEVGHRVPLPSRGVVFGWGVLVHILLLTLRVGLVILLVSGCLCELRLLLMLGVQKTRNGLMHFKESDARD